MSEETVVVADKVDVDSKTAAKYTSNKKENVVKDTGVYTTTSTAGMIVQPQINNVVINLSSTIEIVNLANGQRHSIMPKASKVKMLNTNLYRIPISNTELHMDKFHAIKQYAKYAEFFTIVAVSNGIVSILPIISGFELSDNTDIGSLI